MTENLTQTEVQTFETSFPTWALECFEGKLEEVAKKAKKLKQPVPTFEIVKTEMKTRGRLISVWNPEGKEEWTFVKVTGQAAKIAGYEVLAQLDHVSLPGQVLVRQAPGTEAQDFSPWHNRQVCDHCNTSRKRNETILFRNEAGKVLQIGRNCAADFLRTTKIDGYLSMWKLFADLQGGEDEEGETYFGGRRDSLAGPADEFFALALWVYGQHGWLSKASAQENGGDSTSSRMKIITAGCGCFGRTCYCKTNPMPTSTELTALLPKAQELRALMASLDESSEFNRTLKLLSQADWIPGKYFGTAAAALTVWKRHENALARAAVVKVVSKHSDLPEGGKFKGSLPVTVVSSFSFEGMYGIQTTLILQAEDGTTLKWKTGSIAEPERGSKWLLKAFTVKAHTEYKGALQSEVLRVKYEELEGV